MKSVGDNGQPWRRPRAQGKYGDASVQLQSGDGEIGVAQVVHQVVEEEREERRRQRAALAQAARAGEVRGGAAGETNRHLYVSVQRLDGREEGALNADEVQRRPQIGRAHV